MVFGFGASVVYAVGSLFVGPPPGITTIIVLLLVAIGLNSLGIGFLGEYLGRTYTEAKQRPLYIVQERVNFRAEDAQADPSS